MEKIERERDGFRVTVVHHRANDTKVRCDYDRIISCTGFQLDKDIFDEGCRPEMDPETYDRFPYQNPVWESVNVSGMYFAGTLMQQRDYYRKTTSGFIHGFRYNLRALFHYLEERYHDTLWPYNPIDRDEIGPAIIRLINRSSTLWQQFGFLGNVFVLGDEETRHYEAVPMD